MEDLRVDTSLECPGYRCWQNSEYRNPLLKPHDAQYLCTAKTKQCDCVDRVCMSLLERDDVLSWQSYKAERRVGTCGERPDGGTSARVIRSEARLLLPRRGVQFS
jgi:hypothetical protein